MSALELRPETSQAVSIDAFLGTKDGSTVYPVGSPKWWATELSKEMDGRAKLIETYEDYYEGRHKLTFASSQFREAFAVMLSAISDNWIPLVINASVERLRPQGFLFGDSREGDSEAWRIWQANFLDADAPMAFTEACKHAESYLLIWPEQPQNTRGIFGRLVSRRSDQTPPRITVEHPSQMIVRRSAGDRRNLDAALKRWQESDGSIQATLYLPDAIHRFTLDGDGWIARKGVEETEKNQLGIVPVVPITNEPHMTGCRPPASLLAAPHGVPDVPIGLGRSDQADVISTVDQINKLISDMMVASEVSAFRQRWATGLEVPLDPDTHEPIQPFRAAVDRLWLAPPNEDGENNVRFGEFSTTDLSNYIKAIENRIQSLAARTRTPPHYLLGSIVNASGDALKAAETGLSSKVRGKMASFGEGLEEAIRIAFAWMGDKRATDTSAEVAWAPSESRSESEYVDSLVKKMALGVPKEQLWKDAGYSPQEIARFKSMLLEEGMQKDVFGIPPAPPVGPDGMPIQPPVAPDGQPTS